MSMTLEEIRARLPAWYMSSVQEHGPSYHLESDPGRGKSTLLMDFPQVMNEVDPQGNYGVAIIQGESATLTSITGFQQLLNATHKDGLLRSVFSLPNWWFTRSGEALQDFDGVLILVDEYDKMNLEEKKLIAAARYEKRLGSHWLPPGCVIWTAGNFKHNRSGFTKDFDFSINRTITIQVRDSSSSWQKWCEGNNVLPETINFGVSNPQILFMEAPKVQGPYCTPRSLVQADIHLRSLMKTYVLGKIPLDTHAQEEVAGGIGKEAAEQFFLYIRMGQELPSYEEVVSTPESINIPSMPDQMRLMVYKIADRAQPEHAHELTMWLERFPNEFQIIFARMLRTRNPIVIAKMPREWFKKNAALVALLDNFNERSS